MSSGKWKSHLVWAFLLLSIATLTYLSVLRKSNAGVKELVVQIHKIKGNKNLITKKEISQKFRNYLGYDIDMSDIKDLDPRDLESLLNADDRVLKAEVFLDSHDKLHVVISQKQPIVRVMNKDVSFYLDADGNTIPATVGKTIRVPLATGNIEAFNPALLQEGKKNNLNSVYQLSKYVQDDEFLAALIEQIDVDSKNEITLIPKIGREKITFGSMENMEEKFDNLKLFYREGMPREGWRKFSVLNLNIKNQVIAESRN